MTTLNDLNGYLDDEAYTVRVGELRALLSASIADTAGAKARESLQLTCEQAIRLNAALESPSEPNEALKGAMEKFRAQESRERVSMTYEQFTELASKAKASNDLHMRVLALEASSYLKDEEISHLRKRIAAPPAPSSDTAGASERLKGKSCAPAITTFATQQSKTELSALTANATSTAECGLSQLPRVR